MGVCVGGTERDMANAEVSICFTFEPRGTKKSLEDIYKQRNTPDNFKPRIKAEAEDMVAKKFMLVEGRNLYVFSKDKQEKYFWKPATLADRGRYYLRSIDYFLSH